MSLLSFAKKVVRREKKKEAAGKQKVSTVVTARQVATSTADGGAYQIELIPLTTEKSVAKQGHNVVTFRVGPRVTKGQIAAVVRGKYNVEPIGIRTVTMHAKRRRRGYTAGMTNRWKKAYVTVKDVQSLHLAP